jgi:hypothetical protein
MRDDGGSAFPEVTTRFEGSSGDYDRIVESAGGMTLRDYFAAKTISSVLAGAVIPPEHREELMPVAAEFCYAMADAMLKARAK